jgi:hypothetical protein
VLLEILQHSSTYCNSACTWSKVFFNNVVAHAVLFPDTVSKISEANDEIQLKSWCWNNSEKTSLGIGQTELSIQNNEF